MGMYLGNQPVRVIKRSDNQLLPYPYLDKTTTSRGITYTMNSNGTVTSNGTATGASQYRFALNRQLPVGTYIFSVGGEYIAKVSRNGAWYAEGKTCKIIVDNDEDKWTLYIYFTTGTVLDNVTFYPMLNKGTTAKPFEPYTQYYKIRVEPTREQK